MRGERELGELGIGGAVLVALPGGALLVFEPGHDLEPATCLDRVVPTSIDLRLLNGECGDRGGPFTLTPLDERLCTRGDRGIEDAGRGIRRGECVVAAYERARVRLPLGKLLGEIAPCALLRVIAESPHGLETKSKGPHSLRYSTGRWHG